MESQPQNPEFRNTPENVHHDKAKVTLCYRWSDDKSAIHVHWNDS